MFASAATPNVSTRPAESRQRQRHVEEQDGRVQERGVDREADHGDESEEAVEDEQEDRDEDQSSDRGLPRLVQRVLSERRRDVRPVERLELHGQRARLQDEGDLLRLLERLEALDLRAPAADAAAQARVGEVDLGERLDLAVEDDREVLRHVAELAPDPEAACDLLELVRPRP